MKLRKLSAVALVTLTLSFASCAATAVDVNRIGPLIEDVVDRHDAMVNGTLDPATISDADKATFLRSTALLRAIVNQARTNQGGGN